MIIDTNNRTTPHLACLRQNGVDTVIRYYCRHTRQPEKQLTRAEADAIIGAGMKIGIVYQGSGNSAGAFSPESGAADADYALRYASGVINQPRGSAICFAVDYDASGPDIRNRIVPYFTAVRQALASSYAVGVYGSGAVCQALLDAGLVSLTWVSQSGGFSGTRAFLQSGRWNLRQRLPSTLCGMSVDPNETNPSAPDFGAFSSLGGTIAAFDNTGVVGPLRPAGLTPADIKVVQEKLKGLNYQTGDIDGILGPLTRAALLALQADNHMPQTGAIDTATLAALAQAQPRPLSADRITATADDLRALGSQSIKQADYTKIAALFSSVLGALGIGNSAILQVAGTPATSTPVTAAATTAATQTLPSLAKFLTDLEVALSNPATFKTGDAHVTQLKDALRQLQAANIKSTITPDQVAALEQLKGLIPSDVLAKSPDLTKIFQQAEAVRQAKPPMQTVVDVLPSLFSDGGTLQLLTKGLAVAASSIIPGFGGSLAVLGIGLAAHYFANNVIKARVADHASGANTGR